MKLSLGGIGIALVSGKVMYGWKRLFDRGFSVVIRAGYGGEDIFARRTLAREIFYSSP
jgi:hypothetical protein